MWNLIDYKISEDNENDMINVDYNVKSEASKTYLQSAKKFMENIKGFKDTDLLDLTLYRQASVDYPRSTVMLNNEVIEDFHVFLEKISHMQIELFDNIINLCTQTAFADLTVLLYKRYCSDTQHMVSYPEKMKISIWTVRDDKAVVYIDKKLQLIQVDDNGMTESNILNVTLELVLLSEVKTTVWYSVRETDKYGNDLLDKEKWTFVE